MGGGGGGGEGPPDTGCNPSWNPCANGGCHLDWDYGCNDRGGNVTRQRWQNLMVNNIKKEVISYRCGERSRIPTCDMCYGWQYCDYEYEAGSYLHPVPCRHCDRGKYSTKSLCKFHYGHMNPSLN